MLIFDEVISGFRVARGGAQDHFDFEPDLTILGKVLGGGLPAAAFGGPAATMERLAPAGDVYQAGTLSGNPLAVAAGLATLRHLDADAYERLEQLTDRLVSGISDFAVEHSLFTTATPGLLTVFFGPGPYEDFAAVAACDFERHARFCRAMLDRGIYLPPSQFEAWFLSLAHDEDSIDRTLAAFGESLEEARR
jgi:glutamate-1-semialdehyde 2,1-aminomutase